MKSAMQVFGYNHSIINVVVVVVLIKQSVAG
jgi:hypothetical protein